MVINMISMNKAMKSELQGISQCVCSTQVEEVVQSVIGRVHLIKDCIIYDERGEIKEESINFERILRFVGDWTGYEVSCSEIRFPRERIPKEQMMDFMRKIRDGLSRIIHGEKVVVYISLFEGELELRFHRYRENERAWLADELDVYCTPIIRMM